MMLRSFPHRRRKYMFTSSGFTLIEVLVVLTLILILAAIAIPTFFAWLPGIRLGEASRNLLADMYAAKGEAIKRNENVMIVFSTVSCSPTVPDGSGSYLVFVDDGSGGGTAANSIQDGSEPTIINKSMPDDVALCSENETFGGKIGFTPRGITVGLNSGEITMKNIKAGSFTISANATGHLAMD